MSLESDPIFFENPVSAVPFKLLWIDRSFSGYLDKNFKTGLQALTTWAKLVNLSPNLRDISYSRPTGGRVLSYDLAKPFTDPITGNSLWALDVKGAGLTTSGYAHHHHLLNAGSHQEISRHSLRPDLFGVLTKSDAENEVRTLQALRRQGYPAPCPLAILQPEYFFYRGEKISKAGLFRQFMTLNTDFVLLLRGYPNTTLRVSDLLDWQALSRQNPSPETPIEGHRLRNSKQMVQRAQRYFDQYLVNLLTGGHPNAWYKNLIRYSTAAFVNQLHHGLTPPTGFETNVQRTTNATHLENRTLDGLQAEYHPPAKLFGRSTQNSILHWEALCEAEMDFQAAMSVIVRINPRHEADTERLISRLRNAPSRFTGKTERRVIEIGTGRFLGREHTGPFQGQGAGWIVINPIIPRSETYTHF